MRITLPQLNLNIFFGFVVDIATASTGIAIVLSVSFTCFIEFAEYQHQLTSVPSAECLDCSGDCGRKITTPVIDMIDKAWVAPAIKIYVCACLLKQNLTWNRVGFLFNTVARAFTESYDVQPLTVV